MSLVERFLTNVYQVQRMGKGSYPASAKGEYVPGTVETITIRGSLQPTNARELKLPEEGNRLRQYWALYSDAPLFTDSPRTLAKSDVVTIDGDTYRVMSVETWKGFAVDLPHFKSILYREPEQES